VEISGLDLVGTITLVRRRQRRYLALLLADVETVLGKNTKEYKIIRKLILDNFNDYTRSIFRIVLGDEIEGLVYR